MYLSCQKYFFPIQGNIYVVCVHRCQDKYILEHKDKCTDILIARLLESYMYLIKVKDDLRLNEHENKKQPFRFEISINIVKQIAIIATLRKNGTLIISGKSYFI